MKQSLMSHVIPGRHGAPETALAAPVDCCLRTRAMERLKTAVHIGMVLVKASCNEGEASGCHAEALLPWHCAKECTRCFTVSFLNLACMII